MSEQVLEEYTRLSGLKEDAETEIAAIVEELTSGDNPPGIQGPLVDEEGFPRADIDVYRVRHQRHALVMKQNDHRGIMKQIEDILPEVFQARQSMADPVQPPQGPSSPPTSPPTPVTDTNQPNDTLPSTKEDPAATNVHKKPFAIVDSVQPGSPAAEAGLSRGDLILRFGSADADNHRQLVAIKDIVQHHLNKAIHVVIQRESQVEEVELTPKTWSGPGVLGCLLLPSS